MPCGWLERVRAGEDPAAVAVELTHLATLYHDGRYHIFYLYDRRHSSSRFGTGAHYFEHLSTRDFKHWVEDEAAVEVEFPRGRATISLTWNGARRRNTIRLVGTAGEILVDDAGAFQKAQEYMQRFMPPESLRQLKLYSEDVPLFTRFQIENQIESAYAHKVQLPSGGSLVIDYTEALVSIDINSARATRGSDIETTATGWGAGGWGGKTTGYPDTGWGESDATGVTVDLRLWSQSNFGENLIFCARGGAMNFWAVNPTATVFDRGQVMVAGGTITQKNYSYPAVGSPTTTVTIDATCPSLVNQVMVSDSTRFVIAMGSSERECPARGHIVT